MEPKTTIEPLGDNLLIRKIKATEQTRTSGIILPEAVTQREPLQKAVIVAISEDIENCKRKPGDIVLCYLRTLTPVMVDEQEMALIKIGDVQGWLKPVEEKEPVK